MGVKPGALTALLQEVAAAPEKHEAEPASLAPGTVVGRYEILRETGCSRESPFPERWGRWSSEAATVPKLDVSGAPGLSELVEKMLDRTPRGRPPGGSAVPAALTPIEDALRARHLPEHRDHFDIAPGGIDLDRVCSLQSGGTVCSSVLSEPIRRNRGSATITAPHLSPCLFGDKTRGEVVSPVGRGVHGRPRA
jgi:hypothetical protein